MGTGYDSTTATEPLGRSRVVERSSLTVELHVLGVDTGSVDPRVVEVGLSSFNEHNLEVVVQVGQAASNDTARTGQSKNVDVNGLKTHPHDPPPVMMMSTSSGTTMMIDFASKLLKKVSEAGLMVFPEHSTPPIYTSSPTNSYASLQTQPRFDLRVTRVYGTGKLYDCEGKGRLSGTNPRLNGG